MLVSVSWLVGGGWLDGLIWGWVFEGDGGLVGHGRLVVRRSGLVVRRSGLDSLVWRFDGLI